MPERHIEVRRNLSATTESVWALLADFPDLASHWDGLRSTTLLGEQRSGVGARRRVALKPMGSMDETVTAWEEGRLIETENVPSASVPISRARSRLVLDPTEGGTLARFDYHYVPRGGPLGRLTGPLVDRMLTGTFKDMLSALEKAAQD